MKPDSTSKINTLCPQVFREWEPITSLNACRNSLSSSKYSWNSGSRKWPHQALTAIKEVDKIFVKSERPQEIGSAQTHILEPTGTVDIWGESLAWRHITSVIAKPFRRWYSWYKKKEGNRRNKLTKSRKQANNRDKNHYSSLIPYNIRSPNDNTVSNQHLPK
jgi:hypothetical protein